jgi:sugar/nucleoside kinase (ribokinase family)
MFDCLIAGEANVDLLVDGVLQLEPGKEKLAEDLSIVLGGSSAITAFNLSRLGAQVRFAAALGRDAFGSFVAEKMQEGGVDISAIRWLDNEKTGVTIWHSLGGERAGVTYPGTISKLRAVDVKQTVLTSARHLHVGAYFLLTELHAEAPQLFQRAKTEGMTTSLDCNYDPTEKWDSNIWQTLEHVDIFFPNEQEACLLTGTTDVEAAVQKLSKRVEVLVVKLGGRGALVVSKDETFHQPAISTTVIDTTGAGDTFNAGFLSQYVKGSPLRACAEAGARAASLSVTKVGGTAAFEAAR